jgi:mRNA export factor
MKYQSRTISIFPDKSGFGLGSIEGRVSIIHCDEKDTIKNFSFKCHREHNVIFPVNAISFNPLNGTLATAGSDGSYSFWDKDKRIRLKPYKSCGLPITAIDYNSDASLFAYSVSYDWYKGIEFYNNDSSYQNQKNFIFIHKLLDEDIRKDKISVKK